MNDARALFARGRLAAALASLRGTAAEDREAALLRARILHEQRNYRALSRELTSVADRRADLTGWRLRLLAGRAETVTTCDPRCEIAYALEATEAANDQLALQALVFHHLGRALAFADRWEIAVDRREALPSVRDCFAYSANAWLEVGAPGEAVQAMIERAVVTGGADDAFEAAGQLADDVDDVAGLVRCAVEQAHVSGRGWNGETWEQWYAMAAPLIARAGNDLLAARAIVPVARRRDGVHEGAAELERAYRTFEGEGALEGMASAASAAGQWWLARDAGSSVLWCERAFLAASTMGDPLLEMQTRMALAEALTLSGDLGAAYAVAEPLTGLRLPPVVRADALLIFSKYASDRHEDAIALHAAAGAVELFESLGKRAHLPSAYSGMGIHAMGKSDEATRLALDCFATSASIARELGDGKGEAEALSQIVAAMLMLPPESLDLPDDLTFLQGCVLRGRELQELTGSRSVSFELVASQAELLLGAAAGALELSDRAVAESDGNEDAAGRARTRLVAARMRRELAETVDELRSAARQLDEAVALLKQAGEPDELAYAYHQSADTHWRISSLTSGEERRTALMEARARLLRADEVQRAFMARAVVTSAASEIVPHLRLGTSGPATHDLAVRVERDLGDAAGAFEALDAWKARVLVDALRRGPLLPPEGLDPAWVERERDLMANAAGVDSPRSRRVHSRLLDLFLDDMARQSAPAAEYVRLRRGERMTWSDTREWLARQERLAGRGMAAVSFFETDDAVAVFCARSDFEIPLIRDVPLDGAALRQIAAGIADDPLMLDATRLEPLRPLLEPLSLCSRPEEIVCFIPSGSLFAMPLHAVLFGAEPLIARNPVFSGPSLAALRNVTQRRTTATSARRIRFFGDSRSDLPDSAAEVLAIAAAVGGDVTLRDDATAEAILAALVSDDLVHFAGHAFFSSADPLASGLCAAGNGVVTGYDILDAGGIRAGAVVLSACESAVSHIMPRDEMVGLPRAFLYAGASSVVSSLWRVADDATAALMQQFYAHWHSATAVDALRAAMLDVRGRAEWSLAAAWAPFVLIGDWR